MNNSSVQIMNPAGLSVMSSSRQGAIMFVCTSDGNCRSFGAGEGNSMFQQSSKKVTRELSSSASFRGVGSYSVKRTTSFSAIHEDVSSLMAVSDQETSVTYPSGPRRSRGDQQEGPATGEVPMGDMLLPVLAMAAAYIIIKLFRNRKTSQAL